MEAIDFLRNNHKKKSGGLALFEKINDNVIALIKRGKKIKYVCNEEKSNDMALDIPDASYKIIPHVPLFKERFIGFLSGESGLGKTSLIVYFIEQTYQHLTKKIYYICGKDVSDDPNVKKLRYIKFIQGEKLAELTFDMFRDSLVVFDDIDNWEYHKDAIKLMNNMVEKGRTYKINILYGSHLSSKLSESPIYKEVDLYVTNNVSNNRMISIHLNIHKSDVQEIEKYLEQDCFVCYNKDFRTIVTDMRIYKIK